MKNRHLETFLRNARKRFGDRFDYTLVDYVNQSTKVRVVCPTHGEFSTSPKVHLALVRGCPSCGIEQRSQKKRKPPADFIRRARQKHGNRYDYSKTQYVRKVDKIVVTCREHGDFEVLPGNHLKGKGCAACAGNRKLTKSVFVRRANQIHDHEYDYSLVDYKNMHSTIKVICRLHGEFLTEAQAHIEGAKCQKCTDKRLSAEYRMTTDEFIKKARQVHGNRFDYAKVNYGANQNQKITITCRKHGDFQQSPNKHLQGRGCQRCKASRGELALYAVLERLGIKYKPEKRFKDCRDKNTLPFDVWIPIHRLLIEFDGAQHFAVNRWSVFDLERTQRIDRLKQEFAISKGYRLLRIPYWDLKNIEGIVRAELAQLGSASADDSQS